MCYTNAIKMQTILFDSSEVYLHAASFFLSPNGVLTVFFALAHHWAWRWIPYLAIFAYGDAFFCCANASICIDKYTGEKNTIKAFGFVSLLCESAREKERERAHNANPLASNVMILSYGIHVRNGQSTAGTWYTIHAHSSGITHRTMLHYTMHNCFHPTDVDNS